jgi:hypothetical protein
MIEYIQNCISPGGDGPQKLRYRIPPALFEAFSNLVMFFVFHGLTRATTNTKDVEELKGAGIKCADQCRDLLIEARHQLIVSLHTEDDGARVSYEALESETILALVMENLLGNPLKLDTVNTEIVEAYSEYMSELVRTTALRFVRYERTEAAYVDAQPGNSSPRVSQRQGVRKSETSR